MVRYVYKIHHVLRCMSYCEVICLFPVVKEFLSLKKSSSKFLEWLNIFLWKTYHFWRWTQALSSVIKTHIFNEKTISQDVLFQLTKISLPVIEPQEARQQRYQSLQKVQQMRPNQVVKRKTLLEEQCS